MLLRVGAIHVAIVVGYFCHAHPLAVRPCGAALAALGALGVRCHFGSTLRAALPVLATVAPLAVPVLPTAAAAAAPAAVQDDLEKYLAMPAETNMDLDVLAWWKAKDCKDGLPALAKMAHQFLGRPASSAGVERMFSKAGKLYDDAKKHQNEETLEAALFACANTE